jgi:CheY-like chemotaxis protein
MSAKKIKCLLVDDDTDDQEIFGLALLQVDPSIECAFANDGTYALKILELDHSYIPEVIFIDINMPRMNGIECLKELKKIKRLNKIPIYMYSTSGDSTIIERCKLHGATDFMVKSASITELEQSLSRILSPFKRERISDECKN